MALRPPDYIVILGWPMGNCFIWGLELVYLTANPCAFMGAVGTWQLIPLPLGIVIFIEHLLCAVPLLHGKHTMQ